MKPKESPVPAKWRCRGLIYWVNTLKKYGT